VQSLKDFMHGVGESFTGTNAQGQQVGPLQSFKDMGSAIGEGFTGKPAGGGSLDNSQGLFQSGGGGQGGGQGGGGDQGTADFGPNPQTGGGGSSFHFPWQHDNSGGQPGGQVKADPNLAKQINSVPYVDAQGNQAQMQFDPKQTQQLQQAWNAAGVKTPEQKASWLAQAGTETDGFKTYQQYNAEPNDAGDTAPNGQDYRGRGSVQLTHKENYQDFGNWAKQKGLVDDANTFVNNPEKVADPQWAQMAQAYYWDKNNLNQRLQDRGNEGVSQAVNGGMGFTGTPNGNDQRNALYNQYLKQFKTSARHANDIAAIRHLVANLIDGEEIDAIRSLLGFSLKDVGHAIGESITGKNPAGQSVGIGQQLSDLGHAATGQPPSQPAPAPPPQAPAGGGGGVGPVQSLKDFGHAVGESFTGTNAQGQQVGPVGSFKDMVNAVGEGFTGQPAGGAAGAAGGALGGGLFQSGGGGGGPQPGFGPTGNWSPGDVDQSAPNAAHGYGNADQVAQSIVGFGKAHGWSENDIKSALVSANTETSMGQHPNIGTTQDHDSVGLFQTRNSIWGVKPDLNSQLNWYDSQLKKGQGASGQALDRSADPGNLSQQMEGSAFPGAKENQAQLDQANAYYKKFAI